MVSPRVWLITGTSSGFGHRLVSIVLARGDRVIATAKTLTNITHFLEDPEVQRSNIHCAELDISLGTEQVQKQIDVIIQESGWGTVDVLVNNAGVSTPAFFEEGGGELMRYQYQTNVFGTLDVTTAVLPYMRKQKSGTVVMMSSRSAWKPEVKGLAFYASSKAAVHAIAETMAVELEPLGIRVLIVEPGAFRTEGIYRKDFDDSNLIPDYDDQREQAKKAYRAPAGNQPGDPVKAMKALVEVVCGEGRAHGKAWPLYLVLGKDAERDVRNKCARIIRHLDEWSDTVRDVELDN
ncbi:NAD(P)-binding protein [Imleria badia]|nr:NAD(P)-binding protein [Imleria badia]